MSNKTKQQQQHHHHQQQIHHHQQQQQQQLHHPHPKEALPPRYQPPPQPTSVNPSHQHQAATSGILKPQASYPPNVVVGNGAAAAATAAAVAAGLNHLQQQQQLHHQQQAARLASQVKDAVQSKFAQKVELLSSLQQQSNGLASGAAAGSHQQQHLANSAATSTSSGGGSQQSTRADKLTTGYGLHGKSYLPTAIQQSSAAAATPVGGATTAVGLPSVNGVSSQVPSSLSNGQQQQVAATTTVPRQRISDDEFLRLGPVEMLKFVRKTESDIARLAAEQHRQIQSLVTELRALKETNQRLSNDNQELRDLCCFLDDDRQKGRKLAREWQRFGRYTASVMRQEVEAYQNKLRQLDNKQQELIKDNLELKELCLYLDEERGGGQRDDGDGSSSSTNADEQAPPATPARLARQHAAASTFNDQTMQYVRSLEQRVKQLEEDKSALQARAQQQAWQSSAPPQPPKSELWDPGSTHNMPSAGDDFHLSGRPEAVVRALQVLEVREKLEREAGHDGEKALVREMCNVVWRKLEEGPTQNRH